MNEVAPLRVRRPRIAVERAYEETNLAWGESRKVQPQSLPSLILQFTILGRPDNGMSAHAGPSLGIPLRSI